MSKIISASIVILLLSSCVNFLAQKNFIRPAEIEVSQDFVQGSEDIPLLIGMEKISEESLGFDSASGSIISSSYTTNLTEKQIRNFYLKTLPQMGWDIVKNVEKGSSFKRENENLEIEFLQENNKLIIRFFISSTSN